MTKQKPKAKSIADFKAVHDTETVQHNRIRAALAKLKASGPEAWEYEREFLFSAGIGLSHAEWLRKAYPAHVVEAMGVGGATRHNRIRFVWVGDPKVAARMRPEGTE